MRQATPEELAAHAARLRSKGPPPPRQPGDDFGTYLTRIFEHYHVAPEHRLLRFRPYLIWRGPPEA